MRKKISPKLFKNKKRVWIIGGIGFLVLLVLGFNLFAGGGKNDKASESPTASKVTKGAVGLVHPSDWHGEGSVRTVRLF